MLCLCIFVLYFGSVLGCVKQQILFDSKALVLKLEINTNKHCDDDDDDDDDSETIQRKCKKSRNKTKLHRLLCAQILHKVCIILLVFRSIIDGIYLQKHKYTIKWKWCAWYVNDINIVKRNIKKFVQSTNLTIIFSFQIKYECYESAMSGLFFLKKRRKE